MMFPEETPKDLSIKPSNEESVDKTNDQNSESNVETTEQTIDLSVKKTTVSSEVDDSGVEPMDVTLDLSMPSSVGDVKSNSSKQEVSSDVSDTKSDTQTNNTSNITNGNHVNGFAVSDDSESMILDEELALPPSPKVNRLSAEELKQKQKRMRRLKQELRNEEMKLVLLKKLRQSQIMKENIVTNLAPPVVPPTVPVAHPMVKMMTSNGHSTSRNGNERTGASHLPAPTHTPNLGHSRSSGHSSKGHSVLNPPYNRNQSHSSQSRGPLCPPPLGLSHQRNSHQNNSNHNQNHMPSAAHSQSHSQSLRPGPLSSMNRTPVTTPPNVVLGYPVQDLRAQQNSNSILSSHQSMSLATGSPGPMNQEVTQTPAQRQAAAKLALRKQLEKTLLQIPPPKPPPPEMHFIPNANNQEFVYYLGLETVVDFMTDSPNLSRPPPEPFECVQCGTDFTPVWKWQDRIDTNSNRPAVICETCVTSNIKKALKAEHTNRLKTAFVKALQQEQEIEQRIASGATSPPLPAMSPPQQQNNYNGMNHSVSSSREPQMVSSSQSHLPQAPPAHGGGGGGMPRMSGSAANAAAAAAAVASSAALLQQMPKLSAAHQSLFAAQAQQLHQLAQSLPQPQPAHMLNMLNMSPLLAAQAYSYSMLGKSGVPSTDLHRQYLLDMIPPRSLPQGSINWKT